MRSPLLVISSLLPLVACTPDDETAERVIIEIDLPDLGEGVAEGEIVEWLVEPGESVTQGQPVVWILTDEATVEVPAPEAGTIGERLGQPGKLVPVGNPIFTLTQEAAGR